MVRLQAPAKPATTQVAAVPTPAPKAPVDVQVLEGERVLGSSADGPIVTTAGVHQLDLINAAIGYRSRQTVEIKAGQIVPLAIRPPDGAVSVNALPWAQVWIAGTLVGEKRETTIVKSGAATRVSATFGR